MRPNRTAGIRLTGWHFLYVFLLTILLGHLSEAVGNLAERHFCGPQPADLYAHFAYAEKCDAMAGTDWRYTPSDVLVIPMVWLSAGLLLAPQRHVRSVAAAALISAESVVVLDLSLFPLLGFYPVARALGGGPSAFAVLFALMALLTLPGMLLLYRRMVNKNRVLWIGALLVLPLVPQLLLAMLFL